MRRYLLNTFILLVGLALVADAQSTGFFARIAVSDTQVHTVPAVASDTFTLNAATQTLTNKTLTDPAISHVVFPATASLVAGANTLDDYEEGTWTPVVGGSGGQSGQTYSSQVGTYQKIGNTVYAVYNVILTAKGTITGNVQINGLPFTASNTSINHFNINAMGFWDALATNWVFLSSFVAPNTNSIQVTGTAAAGTSSATPLTTSDISNTTHLAGQIIYTTSQ